MKAIKNTILFSAIIILAYSCYDPNVNPKCTNPETKTEKKGYIVFSKENNPVRNDTAFIDTTGTVFTYEDCIDSTFSVSLQSKFGYKISPSGRTRFVFKNKYVAERGGEFYVQFQDEPANRLESNQVFITNGKNEGTPFLAPISAYGKKIRVTNKTISIVEALPLLSIQGTYFMSINYAYIPF